MGVLGEVCFLEDDKIREVVCEKFVKNFCFVVGVGGDTVYVEGGEGEGEW